MRKSLILDTCALVWLVSDDDHLTESAKTEIEAAQLVYVSAISAWEISLKVSHGALKLPLPPLKWFNRALQSHHLTLVNLTVEILTHANALPWHHRDPADRFIIATALHHNLIVVTSDQRFKKYGIETLL